MSLNSEVQAAVAGWQEYKEPCPCVTAPQCFACYPVRIVQGEHDPSCGICIGTGYVLPAIVKALVWAVTVPCTHLPGTDCNGTGRVPRDWEEVGRGALEGVLRHWYFEVLTPPQRFQSAALFTQRQPLGDSASLAAVMQEVEWVFGRRKAT